MACSRVVFFTLVLSVVSSFAVQVPVFLWGDSRKDTTHSNPFSTVNPKDFRMLLKGQLQDDPFTVVFIEETLSVEDFSSKNVEGETSFPYLEANIEDAIYIPSVENALHVLNKVADQKENHVKLTENGLSSDIQTDTGNFLFIHLKDAKENEPRADMLRRHNDFMEDMYEKLQQRKNKVVAIYTAHFPSWTIPEAHSRVRRQANETQSHGQDYFLDGLRLYVQSIDYGARSTNGSFSEMTNSSTVFDNNNTVVMNTTLMYPEGSLTLNFRMKSGYWFFESVTLVQDSLEEVLPATNEVYALDGFSYRCGGRVSFSSANATEYNVTFIDLKVQPFFKTLNSSEMEYGDAFNCVGFFSVPIWSALMVVFILLSITFYGIMMMMDIRTMDRFDDPKGKTITINASD